MANAILDNIILRVPKSIQNKGMVILPLRHWRKIAEDLEDLAMYRSKKLAKEIAVRRNYKKSIPLKKILEKYKI